MRLLAARICVFFWLSWRVLASPATHVSHVSLNSASNATHTTTSTHKPVSSQRPHSIQKPPTTGLGKFTTPPPPPVATPGAGKTNPTFPSQSSDTGQKPAIIFLEVLGGVFAFLFLVGLLRCLISYKRTPHLDRVSFFIDRHRLQREMEEIERTQLQVNRSSLSEPPPPPYRPPPPTYETETEDAAVAETSHPHTTDTHLLPNG